MRLDSSAGPLGDCEHETALNDQILLEICGASEDDPEVTPQWCTRLRRVPALMDEPCARRGHRLELAMALLAAVLGRLKRYNPAHLPFGYSGPTIRSHNWVERDALERVGKQIAGLMWPTLSAETVAVTIERAVSESVRLGFLEQQQYDAWRPGMPSGSGWRKAVAATPYGILRAENAMPEIVGDHAGICAAESLPEPPCALDAKPAGPRRLSECRTYSSGSACRRESCPEYFGMRAEDDAARPRDVSAAKQSI